MEEKTTVTETDSNVTETDSKDGMKLNIDRLLLNDSSPKEILDIIGNVVKEGLYGLLNCLDSEVLAKVGNINLRLANRSGEYVGIIFSNKVLSDKRTFKDESSTTETI